MIALGSERGRTLIGPLGQGASSGAEATWWDPLAAGLPVVAAYRAISTPGSPWTGGPTAYADTKVNLANPGTYDLTEIGGPPFWASIIGWFGFAMAGGFDTGINPTPLLQNWSAFLQFAGTLHNNDYPFGLFDTTVEDGGLTLRDGGVNARSVHGSSTSVVNNPQLPAFGNYGFAGLQPYRDGVPEGGLIPVGPGTTNLTIYLGATNFNGAQLTYSGVIWAFSIYSGELALAQVGALATAMSQL